MKLICFCKKKRDIFQDHAKNVTWNRLSLKCTMIFGSVFSLTSAILCINGTDCESKNWKYQRVKNHNFMKKPLFELLRSIRYKNRNCHWFKMFRVNAIPHSLIWEWFILLFYVKFKIFTRKLKKRIFFRKKIKDFDRPHARIALHWLTHAAVVR